MSRIVELKAKLRGKNNYDQAYGEFIFRLNTYLGMEKNAYVHMNKWTEELFLRCRDVESSRLESWFQVELRELFLSINQKPSWILEPHWCFYDDKPLTFIDQIQHGEGVLYIFFGREEIRNDSGELRGWRPLYKMIMQDSEGETRLNGDIKG
jgi:hypothetical protein